MNLHFSEYDDLTVAEALASEWQCVKGTQMDTVPNPFVLTEDQLTQIAIDLELGRFFKINLTKQQLAMLLFPVDIEYGWLNERLERVK